MGVCVNSGTIRLSFSLLWRLSKLRHDVVTRNLDQACPERSLGITPNEGMAQCRFVVQQRAQACPDKSRRIGRLDLPALSQPADHELGICMDHDAVALLLPHTVPIARKSTTVLTVGENIDRIDAP